MEEEEVERGGEGRREEEERLRLSRGESREEEEGSLGWRKKVFFEREREKERSSSFLLGCWKRSL